MAAVKKVKKGDVSVGADFNKRNFAFLGIGLAVIILGFVFLAFGDITIAPILLVLGYCVVIPIGILLPKSRNEAEQVEAEKETRVA